jgi:serine/threonine-protein kinase
MGHFCRAEVGHFCLAPKPYNESYPEFSPDGRWLAYVTDESDRNEVYVEPFPGPGRREKVSSDGGFAPAWAANGRELLYMSVASSDTKAMMAVDVTTAAGLTIGRPRMLFSGRYLATAPVRGYDVTPDGRRFLLVDTSGDQEPPVATHMLLVQNWIEEVKGRVPVK